MSKLGSLGPGTLLLASVMMMCLIWHMSRLYICLLYYQVLCVHSLLAPTILLEYTSCSLAALIMPWWVEPQGIWYATAEK